jgi:hypothetical protein
MESNKIKNEITPHSYCGKCGSLVWGEYLDRFKLRKDLIQLVTGYILKEQLEKIDCQIEIETLKHNPYYLKTNPNIVVSWDDDCERVQDEYIEHISNKIKRYKPYKVEVELVQRPTYNCGGLGVYVRVNMYKGITKSPVMLLSKQELIDELNKEKAKQEEEIKIKKMGHMIGELFNFNGEPVILKKIGIGSPIRVGISPMKDDSTIIPVLYNQIKPYYTAHDNLIRKGFIANIKDLVVKYTKGEDYILVDFKNNQYKSNMNMYYKLTRIIYQYQKEIGEKLVDIKDIIKKGVVNNEKSKI